MAVLKANTPAAQRIAPFSLADIEQQARTILEKARIQAERMLVIAQQEAEQLKVQAHAQALAEGKRQGLAQGLDEGRKAGRDAALAERRQELARLAGALADAATVFDAARMQFESDVRKDVVTLAIAIAERVTKRHGSLDPRVMLANLEEAMKLVVHCADVRIAIHPSQQAALEAALPALQITWPVLKHVELIADGTLLPGGCRVFTAGGQIDADLAVQLNRIADELVPADDGP